MRVFDRLSTDAGESGAGDCGCRAAFDDDRLVIDADGCPGDGDLGASGDCRAAAVGALVDRDARSVVTRVGGTERAYEGESAALLVAAGRFADAVERRDPRLATLARRDPLRAARDAVARTDPVARIAAESGLAVAAEGVGRPPDAIRPPVDYAAVLDPFVGPTVARARVGASPPAGARLLDARSLETGGVARTYGTDAGPAYHLVPVEQGFDPGETATLAAAREVLADGDAAAAGDDGAGNEDRAPARAVRRVAGEDDPVGDLTRVLAKHTRGYGVLEDLFADPRVSDVYATAPVDETPLRVVVDGESMPTNVRVTGEGARTLASRLRRETGRAFSRAAPTLDATARVGSGRIRVAGLAAPASDGVAFAFRDHGRHAFTLPALVENGTLPAGAAAILSVAVERDVAGLVAGSRGAGKTTLLGALLWELPPGTRTVCIEDTPELPVEALRSAGRDVQAIRTSLDDGPSIPPTEALRTALRLGDGALVLGEVRGEEAAVLYEAMRVGASASATLGTIHGDGAAAVRERVVSDLGVPASSFAATDLVVTVARVGDGGSETATEGDPGSRPRRVRAVEEVVPDGDDGVRFAPLYTFGADGLAPTGRIDRGDSRVVADLARPDESYADVRSAIAARRESVAALARTGRTDHETVAARYASERR